MAGKIFRASISEALWSKRQTMLVLSRKKNENIIINDNVIVTVIEIRGDKFRLGFDAPRDVPIHRQEVYDAIRRSEMSGDSLEETR